LPVGAKATLIVPSTLAFGEAGYEGIQPYTPLIYDLEVVRIGRFKGKHPTEPGAPLPGFAVTNIVNNVVVQKEDVPKGKTVMVLFSTGCDHCQQLIATINKQYASFNNLHLYFISQDSVHAIRRCMQQYGPLLTGKKNVTVCHDDSRRFAAVFQAGVYPSVYVYNRQVLVKYLPGETTVPGIMRSMPTY
jgi:peroxiredoxin